jgi:hypothetical protein
MLQVSTLPTEYKTQLYVNVLARQQQIADYFMADLGDPEKMSPPYRFAKFLIEQMPGNRR